MAFKGTPENGDLLPLSAPRLQDPRLMLVTDSQDIAAVCESLGIPHADVSGLLVLAEDGDYVEAWFTEYRAPWELASVYQCVKAAPGVGEPDEGPTWEA
jgi:hypothetical protein